MLISSQTLNIGIVLQKTATALVKEEPKEEPELGLDGAGTPKSPTSPDEVGGKTDIMM